jgi:hypothetical protein
VGKSKRHKTSFKKDQIDQEREEKLLATMRESGRAPTAPGGYFHNTDDRPGRKDRKKTKGRLRDLTREFNNDR